MCMKRRNRIIVGVITGLFVVSTLLTGFPVDYLISQWNESKVIDKAYLSMTGEQRAKLTKFSNTANAANFSMQTGYYMGNGATQTISGVGFQPQLLIIKAESVTSAAVFKTSAMPANTTAYFGATANSTASLITLTSDGFSIINNANVNATNIRYSWTAFTGSDCSATGTFCVGTYTGNNSSPRLITTGFQPSYVAVKQATNAAGTFRTSAMAANNGQYFTTTAANTAGALYTSLTSNGFNVGSTNNGNNQVYYYFAFKAVAGVMTVGSYTGNATDNRVITGVSTGTTPNLVMVKNGTSATAASRNPMMYNEKSFGDYTSYISSATANAVNVIQGVSQDAFQVGTSAISNESGATIYWATWAGEVPPPAPSGTFTMASGTYTGTGAAQSVSSLPFEPDLVMIKGDTTQYGVFRTSLMAGNITMYLANGALAFADGITSINSDGFSVGAGAVANTAGATYHWQAFGNAYDPATKNGASDFAIGAYLGNGIDNRTAIDAPIALDMMTTKRNGASPGAWRTSTQAGDISSFFGPVTDANNRIQQLNPDGFQLGSAAEANALGSMYYWFGFKNGYNFHTGSYAGTDTNQYVTSPDMPADLVWVKRTTNQPGALRPSTLGGDDTQAFMNTANYASGITATGCSGFEVGTSPITNGAGGTFQYAVWRVPSSTISVDIVDTNGCPVTVPSSPLSAVTTSFNCVVTTGTIGSSAQRLRVTNSTANPNWSVSIAPTAGTAAVWSNGSAAFDFNDNGGSPQGCSDGVDVDGGEAGQLTLNPSVATRTAKSSCTNAGISMGASAAYLQGSINSITLMNAASAGLQCYWDVTGIGVSQRIPAEQASGNYTIDLTVTVVAQ